MRKGIDRQAVLILLVLCFIWGVQQSVIKAVAGDISTLLQVCLRSGIAALCVWLFSRVTDYRTWFTGVGRAGALVASLFALEFLCLAQALRFGGAAHLSVFLYTAPLFAALGLHIFVPEERLNRQQWSGVLLAFFGVAVIFLLPLMLQGQSLGFENSLLGDLWGIGAGAAWGLTTVVVRSSKLSEAPPTQTLFYQLLGGFLLLLPLVFWTGQTHISNTPATWGSLAFQGLLVSFVTYLIWFNLLRRYWAARLGVLSLMTPIFGVLAGVVLLNETLSSAFVLGAVMIISGILLVNNVIKWPKRTFSAS